MGALEHILAELTAYGCLALFGWTAARRLGVTLPALTQRTLNARCQHLSSSRIRHDKPFFRNLRTLAWLISAGLCVASTSAAQLLPSAPVPHSAAVSDPQPATVSAPPPATISDPPPATISGTVVDTNGGIIPGAKVVLKGDTPDNHREAVAGDNGFFQFANVQPGATYHVTVAAPDFADWTSTPIALMPGQYFLLNGVELRVAAVQTVVVTLPPQEIATEQVKLAEKQRVLGVVPNFYVNYDRHPASLTAKLKFQLAMKALTDPVTIAGLVMNAGIYQAADYPAYRAGMAGYGERLGATFAGSYTHILMGDAVLASLLHQDPRYFYQGTGTTRSRTMHALSSAIFTTGDNGRRQIDYSEIGGDLISGALANAWYPASDRGAGLVIRSSLIGTGGRVVYALAEEFVLSRRHKSQ